MRLIKIIVVCFVVVLTGCSATGIKYKDMMSSIPPMQPDKGRIFFYRGSSMLGAAVQPSIMLDGTKVGDSRRGGFFYVDRAPGVHVVTLTTEVETKRSLNLGAREIKYVKTSVEMGMFVGHMTTEVMYPESAKDDLIDLAYTGDKSSAQDGKTAIVQQPQDSTNQQAATPPQISVDANANAERWSGLMSCEARQDNPARVAYQARFAMEVNGSSVYVHRQLPQVAETLSGQIADNALVLLGEGYLTDTPNRKWQFRISGDFQPGAPIYSGKGNMLSNGQAIRACELIMTRVTLTQN